MANMANMANKIIQEKKPSNTVVHDHSLLLKSESDSPKTYKWDILWHFVIFFSVVHVFAVYGVYVSICGLVHIKTLIYTVLLYICCVLSITAGSHRMLSHKAFEARLPLRIFLIIFQTMGFQFNIFKWVRDHRAHHKYTDTDADPHNSTRGFFFTHIGWLLLRSLPEVTDGLYKIDMSDMIADPIITWQKKHYTWFGPLVAFVLPPLTPYFFWNEQLLYSVAISAFLRFTLTLHVALLVNSFAHTWGTKPYDQTITAVDNFYSSLLSFGEGWHNYHHVFPWDYRAGELSNYRTNYTTIFIDVCEYLGLAYNLKTVSSSLLKNRRRRTGDDGTGHCQLNSNSKDYGY